MKKLFKKIVYSFCISAILSISLLPIVVNAQISGGIGPEVDWFSDGLAVFTANPAWEVFSSVVRGVKGWFTSVDSTNLTISGITGSDQCLQADTNGIVSGVGTSCALSGRQWQFTGPNAITPTSTVGIIVSASSTFTGDFTVGSTTTSMFIDAGGDIDFDSNTLYIDSTNNRVGIGTNNPAATFHIRDTVNSTDVDLRIGDTVESMIQFSDETNDNAYIRMDAASGDLILSKGSTGVNLVIDDGDNVGIGTAGPDYPLSILSTTGSQLELVHTDSSLNAIFQVDAQGDLSATSTSGNYLFGENTTANVGIGVSDPAGSLHARANGVANAYSVIADVQAGAIGRSGSLILRSSLDSTNGTFNSWRFTHYGQGGWQNANNYLGFDTATNLTNWATKMVILDSGNVGIATTSPLTILEVDSNAASTTAIITISNNVGDFQIFRVQATPESTVTGSLGDLAVDGENGKLFIKNTGNETNTGWQAIGGVPSFKSYTFVARDASSGENFQAGFYDYATSDVTLTIGGSVTQTHGGSNAPYAAHAFVVASGAGGTDLVLTVSGTSITDAGVRSAADSEIIVIDADTASTDDYFESDKKWLGTITYTLTGAAGAFTFNYGYTKYEDFGNRDFTVTNFESVGLANANDSGFNIELLKHQTTGWTYAASGFVAGTSAVISMNSIHSTEQDIDNGDYFAFKRAGLSTDVSGNDSEGVIVRVTTGANNSVSYMDTHIGVLLK